MKKVIAITAGVVVAAAGAWVGASWYTGKKIEADVQSSITRLNQQLESNASFRGVSVKIDSYERGILTSHVRYALNFSKDVPIWNVLGAGAPLPFEARIEHGPFAPGALAEWHFSPLLGYVHTEMANSDRARPLFLAAQGALPLTADIRVAYNGDVSFNWHASRQEGTYHDGNVKFAGADGAGAYAQGTQAIKMHGDIGAFSVQSKDDALVRQAAFDGATVDTDGRIGKFGFLVGDSTLKFKHASIDGTGSTVGSLDDVVYRTKMSEDDTALSGEVGLDVGKLKVDDIDMGAAQLVFKFNRLDGVAVRDLSKQFGRREHEDDWLNESVDEDEHEGMEREDALIAAAKARGKSVARLIAGKPSFSIDPLSMLKTPNGEARLTFAIELTSPDEAALEHGGPIYDGPMNMIKTADTTWKVSRTVLKEMLVQRLQKRGLTTEAGARAMVDVQLGTWLSKMVNDKLIKLDGDNLVGSVHYADQVLDWNGSKVPVEKLGAYLSELL
jgi:uncharacterized protein YdgA (DUF945 family)